MSPVPVSCHGHFPRAINSALTTADACLASYRRNTGSPYSLVQTTDSCTTHVCPPSALCPSFRVNRSSQACPPPPAAPTRQVAHRRQCWGAVDQSSRHASDGLQRHNSPAHVEADCQGYRGRRGGERESDAEGWRNAEVESWGDAEVESWGDA